MWHPYFTPFCFSSDHIAQNTHPTIKTFIHNIIHQFDHNNTGIILEDFTMNAPERAAAFLLDEDNAEEKITYVTDTKVSNAGTFTFNKEDHTVGNLIRMQLLRDSCVRFAGYKIPHPLVHQVEMKIQTTSSTLAPIDVLYNAVEDLMEETSTLEREAKSAIERWKKENNAGMDTLTNY